MSELRTFEVVCTCTTPHATRELDLAFTPTRSTISRIQLPFGGTILSTPTRMLRLHAVWNQPLAPGTPVRIILTVAGEPLDQPRAIWTGAQPEYQALTNDEWRQLYDRRKELAKKCPEHAFLFELDRQTNLNFIPFTQIKDKQGRCDLISAVVRDLDRRLQDRWSLAEISEVSCTSHYREISELFARCTEPLNHRDDWTHVGRVLARFAAGDFQQTLLVRRGRHDIGHIVAEPNSYYIFFFAEFALAALDVAAEYAKQWDALLPWLVRMQDYFLHRFDGEKCVTGYDRPARKLSDPDRHAVDQLYDRKVLDRKALECLMFKNLRRASEQCYWAAQLVLAEAK